MGKENRVGLRKPVNVSVIVSELNGADHNAISADISEGGICLYTGKKEIQSGDVVNIKFNILVRGKYMDVKAEARVVHQSPHKYHGLTVGLEFLHLDDSSLLALKSIVSTVR
ncbi:MAG: PilZ domain-containing protein [Pseudomonadota bacterium]